jgi:hypothetical protein
VKERRHSRAEEAKGRKLHPKSGSVIDLLIEPKLIAQIHSD